MKATGFIQIDERKFYTEGAANDFMERMFESNFVCEKNTVEPAKNIRAISPMPYHVIKVYAKTPQHIKRESQQYA